MTPGEMRLIGTIDLPGALTAPREARHRVRRLLIAARLGLDDDILDDIEVCVSELTTNAVTHTASGRGGRVIILVLAGRGKVRIAVLDDGKAGTKPHVHHEACAENGRGLQLVDELSSRWDSDPDPNGTAVWAEFTCAASAG